MNRFQGDTLSWAAEAGVVTVTLHREPANEIGSRTLEELEILSDALPQLEREARVMILHSGVAAGFSAGADLRELYRRMQGLPTGERERRVRDFLVRIHRVLDAVDQTQLTTIAALHGVVFGGGLELALTCDILIADRMTRFCFPELRLGLIPGFGGTPRLRRDLGNAVVRDLLLLGRSLGADRAYTLGLVSQLAGEGRALDVARACARQAAQFDPVSARAAKDFVKRLPREDLDREIDVFCNLFARPAVEEALRRFVETEDPMPWLPVAPETRK